MEDCRRADDELSINQCNASCTGRKGETGLSLVFFWCRFAAMRGAKQQRHGPRIRFKPGGCMSGTGLFKSGKVSWCTVFAFTHAKHDTLWPFHSKKRREFIIGLEKTKK